MKKLGIILILAACLALLCVAGGALADFPASGNCGETTDEYGNIIIGDNATFSFDSSTGTLTISGTGKMNDDGWSIFQATDKEKREVEKIVISEGITSIGNSTFSLFEKVTTVELPSSLKSIGDYAFSSCKALKTIAIPNGVASIGTYAFSYCDKLSEATLPASLKAIEDSVFSGCNALKSVVIPEGVKSIGINAFESCSSLKSVTIPESVTKIEDHAFSWCSALESLTIPKNVTTLGDGVFQYCSSLKSVTLPDSITAIPDGAFRDDVNLSSIVIPSGVTSIGEYAFHGCGQLVMEIPDTAVKIGDAVSGSISTEYIPTVIADLNSDTAKKVSKAGYLLREKGQNYSLSATYSGDQRTSLKVVRVDQDSTSVVLADGITEIGEYAFGNCTNLQKITIPATVTSIGARAFQWCNSLKELSIPNGVTTIGDYAFEYSGLINIELPDSVTSIGKARNDQYSTVPSVITDPKSARGKQIAEAGYDLRVKGKLYSVRPTYSGDSISDMSVVRIDYDDSSLLSFDEGVTSIDQNCSIYGSSQKIKYMELPLSLKSINAYLPWWDVQNIFYAGTEADKALIKSSDDGFKNEQIVWHFGEKAPADLTDLWTVTYEWDFSNPNQYKLRAKAVCKNDPNHVIEETVNAWYNVDTETNPEQKYATCTEDGLMNINSDGFRNSCFTAQNKTDVVIPALGHDYSVNENNQPQYAWSIDYSKAFASLHCNRCWNEQNNLIEEAETTSTVQAGKKTYTAVFKDPRFEKQTVQVVAGRDITPPQLTKVTLASKKLSKPGILYVTLDFVEDESGLQSCWINTSPKGKTNWTGSGGNSWEGDPPFTGTITLEVPIDTKFPAGEHYITNIQLEDTKGNRINYNVDTWNYSPTGDYDMTKLVARDEGGTYAVIASVPIDNGFEVTEDSDADFEYLITAPKLTDEVKNLRKDGQGVILFNYNKHVAPKALFEAMKGKDATYTFSNNEIQWQWKGTDITEECKDVDLEVRSWTEPGTNYGIEGGEDVLVIQFADNGKLPGPAKIRIKSDYYFKINGLRHAAYLYFLNEGTLYNQDSGVSAVLDKDDHWCEFVVTHNSTFIISANQAQRAADGDPTMTPEQLVQAFVKRCYKLILNRDADEGGLTGWSSALINKEAAAAKIIEGFVASEEYTNRNLTPEQQVDILYQTMLGREADEGGKAGWVDALSKGYTFQHIINGFCGSDEFKKICDGYGIEPGSVNAAPPADTSTPRGKIEAFVRRCYSLILSREADQGGLTGWSDALESKAAPAARIIEGFVASEEYTNRNLSAEQSVDILYKTMLGREADADGKAGWVDALSKGYTFQHIINGFCGSAEFTAICNEYGIEAGSVAIPQGAAVIWEGDILEEAKKLPDERIGVAVSADEKGAAVIGYEKDEVEAFVKHAYAAALGREADEAGLAGWTEQLMTGAVSPKAFLKSLLTSDEFAARGLSDEAFVEVLYKLYLNRGADEVAAERIAALAAGGERASLIAEFETSVEFRVVLARFGL